MPLNHLSILTLPPHRAPLCHTLPQASMPTPPSQAFYKNRTTNSKIFCPIIWLRSSSSSLIERQLEAKKEKPESQGSGEAAEVAPKKSARRRGLLPGGGRKGRGGQPCIKPAAAMLARLARAIQPKWLRERHEMWQVLLEISSSLPWDLARFY